MPPLTLRATHAQPIAINAEFLVTEYAQNSSFLIPFIARASGIALVMAYDSTEGYRTKTARQGEPLWQFLRHCRNAAAHHGRFKLDPGQPDKPAEWRSKKIEPALQGRPLFGDERVDPGFILPGDVLHLLWDIEQQYPDLS